MNYATGNRIKPSVVVRDGFTRRERLLIADRDPRTLTALDGFTAADRAEICRLCDAFAIKHRSRLNETCSCDLRATDGYHVRTCSERLKRSDD